MSSDIAAGKLGAPIDLTPALDPAALSIAGGIGQDTATDEAIVPFNDAFNPTAPGRVVVADLNTGAVSHFPSVSTFFAAGVALDSRTHRALIPSIDSFGIYDLTARTGTAHTLGGSTYWHPAVDSGRGLFLLQETAPPDLFNVFLLNAGAYVQVSPVTGSAYTLGPGARSSTRSTTPPAGDRYGGLARSSASATVSKWSIRVTSIGADPQWLDRGEGRRFERYWSAYSWYLCILAARDSRAEKLFLPFDDDPVLSLILSKAFLLANDLAITDETITAQIRRR